MEAGPKLVNNNRFYPPTTYDVLSMQLPALSVLPPITLLGGRRLQACCETLVSVVSAIGPTSYCKKTGCDAGCHSLNHKC
jgi:hypothetical protein